MKMRMIRASKNFYPRSPCGERQSPAGRINGRINFYPRSPCGERLDMDNNFGGNDHISIHALLAESDRNSRQATVNTWKFLSTLSLRRATLDGSTSSIEEVSFLSTLSLRRATRGRHINKTRSEHFYPRSPCGERLVYGFGREV